MQYPQATDVTLGGQTSPPIDSAVLGGIAGLRQQMTAATPEQRSQLLNAALNYAEAGVDLLITTLNNDPVLTVRSTAYQQLQQAIAGQTESILEKVQQVISRQSKSVLQKVRQAIAKGIPLKQGDRIYKVYISAIDYDDNFYTLLDSVQAYEAHDFCYEGEQFHLVKCYIFREQAEQVASDLHRVILSNDRIAEFNQRYQLNLNPRNYHLFDIAGDLSNFERNAAQPIQDWCTAHEIDINLYDLYEYIPTENPEESDYWWDEQDAVLQEFQMQRNYPLLEEFCDLIGIGRFTFVHEEIVDRDGYFPVTGTLI